MLCVQGFSYVLRINVSYVKDGMSIFRDFSCAINMTLCTLKMLCVEKFSYVLRMNTLYVKDGMPIFRDFSCAINMTRFVR